MARRFPKLRWCREGRAGARRCRSPVLHQGATLSPTPGCRARAAIRDLKSRNKRRLINNQTADAWGRRCSGRALAGRGWGTCSVLAPLATELVAPRVHKAQRTQGRTGVREPQRPSWIKPQPKDPKARTPKPSPASQPQPRSHRAMPQAGPRPCPAPPLLSYFFSSFFFF